MLDGALLFFDEHNAGRPELLAESYAPDFSPYRRALSSLEPTQIVRSLGIPRDVTETVALTASELNCWTAEGMSLPDSANAVLFHVGAGDVFEVMLIAVKNGFFMEDQKAELEQFFWAWSDLLTAKLDYERMEKKSEEAESLISVVNAINSTMDPQQLFQLIIEKAVELIPDVDGAAIVTFDEEGRGYYLQAGYGYYKSLLEESKANFDIPERAMQSGGPLKISPSEPDNQSDVAHSGIKSAICVPISERNRKIGAILLESSQKEDCFSEENIPLLRAFADSIGLAISKAQSHHMLKEKYSRLEEDSQTMGVTYPQLLQSEKLATVGELASSIAHDINNPLMTIMARTDILLSRMDPRDPMHKSIEVIEKQVERIAKLVKGILGFARMSRPEFASQDINQVVTESILLTENHLKNKNIRLKRGLGEDLPLTLADKNKLQQVFLNLITNAAQAMTEGGTLTVSTGLGTDRLGNQSILVSFSDTGYGIETEDLGKIFDSFFTTKENGTGLGLAIAKGIVDEHGGSISVESDVGKGTTVTVMLPPISKNGRSNGDLKAKAQ